MKIFHIVEEISKKNNSIVSVSKILTSYEKSKKSKIIIPQNNILYSKKIKQIKQIKIFKNIFKYKSEVYKFLDYNQPDIIHIHGLWRPIHLIFIIVSLQLNIPIIIQPHGMLLDEAIKTKSKFTYLIKLIIISIYKILLRQAVFVAVTAEEKKSIYKYFKTKKIKIIQNPFDSTFKVEKSLKKKISYFGRFSPHKNLELVIDSFLDANLNNDWKLFIYGIDDDPSYKLYIKKLIKERDKNKKIKIKEPIFDKKKKFQKISESYLNILMSKSEILSLSVLEGLSVGTRSLVNNQIKYPKNISNLLYFTSPQKNLVIKKMREITQKFSHNYVNRNKIKKRFQKNYNLQISKNKYDFLTKKIINLKSKNLDIDFFNISIANGLNSFLVPFLVVIFGFINPSISAEIGIIEGTVIYLTQIFSSNSRAILLNEKDDKIFHNFISFRLFLSLGIISIFIFIFSNITFIERDFHKLLISLVLISWINEITLVYIEMKKLKYIMRIFILSSLLFYLLLIFNILLGGLEFNFIILSYFIFQSVFIVYFFNFNSIFKMKYSLLSLYENIFPFLSTFSNTSAVLFWRYSILYFTSKEIAGVVFAIFSIASFPGTFYNNILGQTILRQSKLNQLFVKYESNFYYISIIIIISGYFIFNNIDIISINKFILNTITISLLGTIIMIISLRKRHRSLFQLYKFRDLVFKRDIMYSLIILPTIFILYKYNGLDALTFAYFISAIISYILYSFKYATHSK